MLARIKRFLDLSLELLVMSVVVFLVIDVLWQVFTRFGGKIPGLSFIKPSRWTDELATFLLIWVALLGAAVALNRGAHLGIDYFVGKLEKKTQVKVEVFIYLCVALFSIFVMILGGADLVQTTLSLEQKSPALGIDMGYVYLAVPVSGFFMALYSIIEFFARISLLLKGPQAIQAYQPKHEIPEDVD